MSSPVTLTPADQTDLERLERVVGNGIGTFLEVAKCLAEISERELYRPKFAIFEHYCGNQFGMSDRRARKLIAACETCAGSRIGPLTLSRAELIASTGISETSIWRAERDNRLRAVAGLRTKVYAISEVKRFLKSRRKSK